MSLITITHVSLRLSVHVCSERKKIRHKYGLPRHFNPALVCFTHALATITVSVILAS